MRILVVNDDGIDAPGIKILANLASRFGETFVVAPSGQCSAMSQKVSIQTIIEVQKVNYEADVKAAYSVSGTPADCVKIAFEHLNIRPDVVFSGINNGYNTGFDIAYSGTVGACFEALQKGVPAIAFSTEWGCDFDTVNAFIEKVTLELLEKKLPKNQLWNVNFPGIKASECKGILYDRKINQSQHVMDNYKLIERNEYLDRLDEDGIFLKHAEIETDEGALINGYISIGTVTNCVINS